MPYLVYNQCKKLLMTKSDNLRALINGDDFILRVNLGQAEVVCIQLYYFAR